MFKRAQEDILINLLKNSSSRNVIVVEGARQVGKTTLVTEVLRTNFQESTNINLETDLASLSSIDSSESFKDLELYLENKFNFKDAPGAVLFIDEAQESRALGRYVRSFKEEWKHARVILSGSSMSRLFREDQRIPVGRYTSILVTPFTFLEFIKATGKDALVSLLDKFRENPSEDLISTSAHKLLLSEVNNYFTVGGLPEVISQFINKDNWRSTRNMILLSQTEDFIRKSEFKDRFVVTSALKGIANNLGSPSKYTHICEKYHDAKKLTSILKAWKLVFEITQKGNAPTSVFFPKRYIYDIGIAQDLREHPFPDVSLLSSLSSALRTPLGGLMENALFLQLISDMNIYGISGWKGSKDQNKEIDFVIKSNNLIPVECKATTKLSPKNFYGPREYLKASGLKTAFLVSLAPFKIIKEEEHGLINLPFYLAQNHMLEILS